MQPDPKSRRNPLAVDIALGSIALFVLGVVVFQLFLRFTYVHTNGNHVVRVDRLSGQSCTLPCLEGGAQAYEAPTPEPTAQPDKVCHPSDVVRVAAALRPPRGLSLARRRAAGYARPGHRMPPAFEDAVELSDGHIYAFSHDAFANDVHSWTTGQDVQVCATWSKLEERAFYSVGGDESSEPASLVL